MIILRLLLLLTNLHLKLLSTQGTGADKLLSTQRVKERCSYTYCYIHTVDYKTKYSKSMYFKESVGCVADNKDKPKNYGDY